MRYAKIMKNDCVDGNGVCVSLWVQGCPYHCKGCHNPQTWDFNKGIVEDNEKVIEKISKLIEANGIQRNFSILGGEPLCEQNLYDVYFVLQAIRKKFPNIEIILWTGLELNDSLIFGEKFLNNSAVWKYLSMTLLNCNKIVDGPYVENLRDITLKYRGSSNQRIIDIDKTKENKKITLSELN